MRIIIGGAHNGKRNYVRTILAEQENNHVQWFEGELPQPGSEDVVVGGLEKWLAKTDLPEKESIDHIIKSVEDRNVILILTDIGRGIVPMDAQQRKLRDVCGRLYQRLFAEADEITRIWYGIAQNMKRGD